MTPSVITRYVHHLACAITRGGRLLAPRSIAAHLATVRAFFRFLVRARLLLVDPTRGVRWRRGPRGARLVLSVAEMRALLSRPNVRTPGGLRDRAILELFYATGIRRGELVHLDLFDVHRDDQTVTIRQGKGGADRVVPLGRVAGWWLTQYLVVGRPVWHRRPREAALFLSQTGHRLGGAMVGRLVAGYARAAGIPKRVHCHLLRHTCATHLLEGGADIRYVAELLGHRQLSTTQCYLQLGLLELKAAHARAHPRAAWPRRPRSARAGMPPGTPKEPDHDADV